MIGTRNQNLSNIEEFSPKEKHIIAQDNILGKK
jgi:hypothetical protein